jgi:hypothetical protein
MPFAHDEASSRSDRADDRALDDDAQNIGGARPTRVNGRIMGLHGSIVASYSGGTSFWRRRQRYCNQRGSDD